MGGCATPSRLWSAALERGDSSAAIDGEEKDEGGDCAKDGSLRRIESKNGVREDGLPSEHDVG